MGGCGLASGGGGIVLWHTRHLASAIAGVESVEILYN